MMEDHITLLRSKLDAQMNAFKRWKIRVVNRNDVREQVRDVVRAYFEQHRPALLQQCHNEDLFQSLDSNLQELITYCNARTLRSKYLKNLKAAKENLTILELACLRATPNGLGLSVSAEAVHNKAIIETLAKVCLPASISYAQGLQDLADQKRQSWRGTVVEFREALRETLDQLAPDNVVENHPDFKLENGRKKPTMKQKVVFILKSRRVGSRAIDTAKTNVDLIEEKTGAFIRSVYDLASDATHGVPTRNEALSVKNHLALILTELLKVPSQ